MRTPEWMTMGLGGGISVLVTPQAPAASVSPSAPNVSTRAVRRLLDGLAAVTLPRFRPIDNLDTLRSLVRNWE